MLQQLAGREHTGEREEIVSSLSRLRASITQCCLAAKGSAIDLKVASFGQNSCCFCAFPPLSFPCVVRYLVLHNIYYSDRSEESLGGPQCHAYSQYQAFSASCVIGATICHFCEYRYPHCVHSCEA